MGIMSKEDGDAIKNWISLCLDLNFTAAWDLDLFGLVTLTIPQLRRLWKVLGDDDADRAFRLNIVEQERLTSEENRKQMWMNAVMEVLQNPRKLDRFGYSLKYTRTYQCREHDVPFYPAGNYTMSAMMSCSSLRLEDLLTRPDGDPTLVLSAKRFYGIKCKEPKSANRIISWIHISNSRLSKKKVTTNVREISREKKYSLVTDESLEEEVDDDASTRHSDMATCHPLRVV